MLQCESGENGSNIILYPFSCHYRSNLCAEIGDPIQLSFHLGMAITVSHSRMQGDQHDGQYHKFGPITSHSQCPSKDHWHWLRMEGDCFCKNMDGKVIIRKVNSAAEWCKLKFRSMGSSNRSPCSAELNPANIPPKHSANEPSCNPPEVHHLSVYSSGYTSNLRDRQAASNRDLKASTTTGFFPGYSPETELLSSLELQRQLRQDLARNLALYCSRARDGKLEERTVHKSAERAHLENGKNMTTGSRQSEEFCYNLHRGHFTYGSSTHAMQSRRVLTRSAVRCQDQESYVLVKSRHWQIK
ncbi:hypothetical protein BJ742DRAFT_496778 [Cladochytrium replicatum]|nr:hypothetical protein BJ742DRAFT_496778 [Cladochytrium replicatum]